MKWFMATNEESLQREDFFRMVMAALKSAKKNTSLEPFLIYDGERVSRLDVLVNMGVRIFFHSSPISDRIKSFIEANYSLDEVPRRTRARQGAYLRYEIPHVLKRSGILDPYVLYTD
ncbi:MAG: hypothetical protein KatS3mg087_2206 [Patescibacteria group bacterium]|nr:MAG: hypothetical protein KatS3mg087_2206 [Patescibacteria group bacterium]